MAVDVGMERLLGGLHPEELQKICDGQIQYYSFLGLPEGHPTKLRGTPDQMAEHCRRFAELGCPGVDLLAYRAIDADPLDLVRAALSAMDGYITCAGSVDSPERIRALAGTGTDAFTIPDAVVLGFDMTITYRRIRAAAELIQAGVPFIATHPDPVCPKENGLVPDCGSMIELLVPAAGKRPLIIGKPHSRMVDAALTRLGTTREQTAIIGDLLLTDMRMARENGLMGILVLSGETSKQDVENSACSPDLVLQNAGEFASLLRSAMEGRRLPVSREGQ